MINSDKQQNNNVTINQTIQDILYTPEKKTEKDRVNDIDIKDEIAVNLKMYLANIESQIAKRK